MSDAATLPVERPVAPPRPWTRSRIIGHTLVAFWIVVAIALTIWLYNAWRIDLYETYGPRYWNGLKTTLVLVGLSLISGAILSVPLAMARLKNKGILSNIAYGYVYFFRGTPMIAQVFLIYYGIGQFSEALKSVGIWGFFRDAWNCAFLAFTLNTAAYQAEILRGAIQSVPKGQWEGAAALGLPRWYAFLRIILPQALIVALRPYGNEIILMVKGSAIVAIVTVYDLMGETRRAFSRTFDFQTYIWAAVIYLAIVELLRNVWDLIEKRLTRHLKR